MTETRLVQEVAWSPSIHSFPRAYICHLPPLTHLTSNRPKPVKRPSTFLAKLPWAIPKTALRPEAHSQPPGRSPTPLEQATQTRSVKRLLQPQQTSSPTPSVPVPVAQQPARPTPLPNRGLSIRLHHASSTLRSTQGTKMCRGLLTRVGMGCLWGGRSRDSLSRSWGCRWDLTRRICSRWEICWEMGS